jgi:hypothetical protein
MRQAARLQLKREPLDDEDNVIRMISKSDAAVPAGVERR